MREFYFKENELWCENVVLKLIAERFGTPLYVYSKRSILDHCQHIEEALRGVDHLSCYAVKANANRSILRLIAGKELGADVGSIGELVLAIESGFTPEKITFSGVGKRDDEIEYALEKNILAFNVESEEELITLNGLAGQLKRPARIFLRVNFDVSSGTHPYITTSGKHSKFGVDQSEVKRILFRAQKLPSIEIIGIHSHLGSQITDQETFIHAAHLMVQLVDDLRRNGIPIKEVNFGGGFGVQYHDYISDPHLPQDGSIAEKTLTTVALLESVIPILRQINCKIIIQPGRSIVAHAGVLLTKVLYRKQNPEYTFIIVDAGMNDLIRPSLYQSYHQIVPLAIRDVDCEVVDVVGPLCEAGDFFALDRTMPRVNRGEYLSIMCTGAYGYVLSSNYNCRPRPAEVMVDGTNCEIISERELVDQL
ncbi:MAG TPA: diaminopimelate decarboxylase [Bacteroidota bacterium]|nr:diaminopimelate decarboxylase [Bacteroidota bacterium]